MGLDKETFLKPSFLLILVIWILITIPLAIVESGSSSILSTIAILHFLGICYHTYEIIILVIICDYLLDTPSPTTNIIFFIIGAACNIALAILILIDDGKILFPIFSIILAALMIGTIIAIKKDK